MPSFEGSGGFHFFFIKNQLNTTKIEMDRKSKKTHQSETKGMEKDQGRQLEAAAGKVSDQAEVKKVRDRRRGGTADAEREIQQHLGSASEGLKQAFSKDAREAGETGRKIEKAAGEDAAERDQHYQEGKALGDAASKVKHGETKTELGQVRDTHAKDAVFFNDQRKKRDHLAKEGKRIGKELQARMDKLGGGGAAGETSAEKSGGERKKVEWTNPQTGEKYIHKEKGDGVKHLLYGPPDTKDEKRHGHAVFDQHGRVEYNRNPKGE